MNKHSDLNPALGLPTDAGPCFVVERIEDTVRSPRQRGDLESKVEMGESLSNPDAAAVYKPMVERGPGGLFPKMELTSHSQYRMDLRGITVADIRFGLQAFQKDLSDWKSRQSSEYKKVAEAIARRQTIEYLFKKWDLFLAFTVPAKGVARIVTLYWEGVSDPRAPGSCVVPHAHRHGGYRAPVDNWTPQTYRKEPGTTPDNQEKQQVLPAPNGGKTKDLGPQTFNGPGPSGTGPGGRSVHKDMARTKGVPGGDHPHPAPRTSPQRRPDVTGTAGKDSEDAVELDLIADWFSQLDSTPGDSYPPVQAAMKGKPFPGADRQRDQRGLAKRYYKVRYKQKRNEYKLRANKWYKRYKNNPRYKKDQERRTESPERFERRPGGGIAENKDRATKDRAKKKASTGISVFHVPTKQHAGFMGLVEDGYGEPCVHLQLEDDTSVMLAVEDFFNQVWANEEATEEIFAALDAFFEWQEDEMGDLDEMSRTAVQFALKYRPVVRQTRQKGKAKWEAKQQARKNRAQNKMRARKRYKRLKRLPAFKKQQQIRRQHPERFKRRMAQVLTAPEIAFVIGEDMDLGYVRSVSPMTGLVTFYRVSERSKGMLWDSLESMTHTDFMASVGFLSEADEDAMFTLLDVELGLDAWSGELSHSGLAGSAALMGVDCSSPEFQGLCEKLTGKAQIPDMSPAEVALVDSVVIHQLVYDDTENDGEYPSRDLGEAPSPADPYLIDPTDDDWYYGKVYLPSEYLSPTRMARLWVARQAEMLYEKHPPKMDTDTVYDRAQSRVDRKDQKAPLEKKDDPVVEQNPGSAKVIPWDNPDFVNNKAAMARVATRIHEIVDRCGADLVQRSSGLKPRLMRVDVKNAVWLFDVPGSKTAYRVRVKALRKGNVSDAGKVDVKVSCSCPFWQWQGPEHHAKQGGYLYGTPAGTASAPTEKDPDGTHAACKHVLAVFNHISSKGWRVPRSRQGSVMVDAESSLQSRALAARYLLGLIGG